MQEVHHILERHDDQGVANELVEKRAVVVHETREAVDALLAQVVSH
jgi:hypothetical protein